MPVSKVIGGGLLAPSYTDRLIATGPFAGWVMGETSGLVSIDEVNSPAQDGTYTGVTLGQPGIGDGNTSALVDGVDDYNNIYSPTLAGVFNGSEGTALAWSRTTAWLDGAFRRILYFGVDGNNYIDLRKNAANNQLALIYTAGGVIRPFNPVAFSSTDWFSTMITWSASADEVSGYVNGVPVASTLNGLGAWAGVLSATSTVIGAFTTTPLTVWDGPEAHCWLWNRPLTPTEALSVGVL